MEAFSDGVLAVIITVMVLEMQAPRGIRLIALRPLLPLFISYVLSFLYIGIYWNNHHHLLHAAQHVTGGILWANLHLLFWLSLTPFATAWMGENHLAPWPVALYGVILLLAAIAYFVLTRTLIAHHGTDSTLALSIGSDRKGKISVAVYAIAIPLAFALPWVACVCYFLVAVMWLVPDPRIEKTLGKEPAGLP
jgi:TMEM175 potassium channel family protein